MRKPSDKTALATERRTSRRLQQECASFSYQLGLWRDRAVKAEKELAEWKSRFDELLKLSVQRATGEAGDSNA